MNAVRPDPTTLFTKQYTVESATSIAAHLENTLAEEGTDAARSARLETAIRDRWRQQDNEADFRFSVRQGGLMDVTVVSRLFQGCDDREREALFWPVFEPVLKSDRVFLTFCLLLTPEEANRYFAELPATDCSTDSWDDR